MEQLQYVIEDKTIAELLGVQNFSTDESAILELVKNAYDAHASFVKLVFDKDNLTIIDDGIGMDLSDIKDKWMHVGKSTKNYTAVSEKKQIRVLAGSKGVGRFALARLGKSISIITKKAGIQGLVWTTDWDSSSVSPNNTIEELGTKIVIEGLRTKWNSKRIGNLKSFLSKTYNDDVMDIIISFQGVSMQVAPYVTELIPGINCQSQIKLYYDSSKQELKTEILSDEFSKDAKVYCEDIDLNQCSLVTNIFDELVSIDKWGLSKDDLESHLKELGDFTSDFSFTILPSKEDAEKFLYKHRTLPNESLSGVILYRNAFSISSYEGSKDWLGFGKRSRKSPAAASHPTGAWRVRENQMAGKVEIDKQRNAVLQDLSNRQGLDENIFYEIFVEIILIGIKNFERYRQNIIRKINVKNIPQEEKQTPISEKLLSNPGVLSTFTREDTSQLVSEIKAYKKAHEQAKKEYKDVETRYKYDVRILNVLSMN